MKKQQSLSREGASLIEEFKAEGSSKKKVCFTLHAQVKVEKQVSKSRSSNHRKSKSYSHTLIREEDDLSSTKTLKVLKVTVLDSK